MQNSPCQPSGVSRRHASQPERGGQSQAQRAGPWEASPRPRCPKRQEHAAGGRGAALGGCVQASLLGTGGGPRGGVGAGGQPAFAGPLPLRPQEAYRPRCTPIPVSHQEVGPHPSKQTAPVPSSTFSPQTTCGPTQNRAAERDSSKRVSPGDSGPRCPRCPPSCRACQASAASHEDMTASHTPAFPGSVQASAALPHPVGPRRRGSRSSCSSKPLASAVTPAGSSGTAARVGNVSVGS